jgi:hypothetical protein
MDMEPPWVLALQIECDKDYWLICFHRNVPSPSVFRLFYDTSESQVNIILTLLGMRIEIQRWLVDWQICCPVKSLWQKTITFLFGAYIHKDYAYFREIGHGEHFSWLFGGRNYYAVRK